MNLLSIPPPRRDSRVAVLLSLAVSLSSAYSSAHAEMAIEDVLVTPETELSHSCQNVAVNERFRLWKERLAPPDPFASVADIVKEVTSPTIEAAVEKGCNRDFFAFFMACTQYDDPTASSIVRSGITANSEADLSRLVVVCLRAASLMNLLLVQEN